MALVLRVREGGRWEGGRGEGGKGGRDERVWREGREGGREGGGKR